MYNPFKTSPYIETADGLYERKMQLQELREKFLSRIDTSLFGPEGSGKSALLRCFFSLDYQIQMAKKRTLIYLGAFPDRLDGEDTYSFFAEKIKESLGLLKQCDMRQLRSDILEEMDQASYETQQSRFGGYLTIINRYGFRMVFVLDNFENFTSSTNIKEEHHDLLCGMLNNQQLQLIVATNYDFNQTSLPRGARNSTLLSRLNPNRITMTPLSEAACKALLDDIAEEKDDPFRFTEEQVRVLHGLSGGVVQLLQIVAQHAFDVLHEGTDDWEQEVAARALTDACPLLKRWCKFAPEEQMDLLHTLREEQILPEKESPLASVLEVRGLLKKNSYLCRDGKEITADGYLYNSGLFRRFCAHRQWLDELLENNPLRPELVSAPMFDLAALMGGGASAPGTVPGQIIVEKVEIHNDHRVDNSQKTEVKIENAVITDQGFKQLFGFLDLQKDELRGRLEAIFDETTPELPLIVDAPALPQPTEEEREAAVEQKAQRIAAMFVPEAVETKSPEEFREEEKTLESRFNKVRSAVDPRGLLDDELLASLSHKCRLYLQIAFVVDNALAVLDDFKLGDLSARMVMYGKVLEQQLKDTMYPLFRNDGILRDFDVKTHTENANSPNNFGCLRLNKTAIGDYVAVMRFQSNRLGALCSDNDIRYHQKKSTAKWWEKLGDDVDKARVLRNGGDHAGTETSKSDLAQMRELLFGNGKILGRCGAGDQLYQVVRTQGAAASANIPSAALRTSMQGKIVTMTNIEATSRQSIRGTIAGTAYGVSVSTKCLEKGKKRAEDLAGKSIQVRILSWDGSQTAQKFVAELP